MLKTFSFNLSYFFWKFTWNNDSSILLIIFDNKLSAGNQYAIELEDLLLRAIEKWLHFFSILSNESPRRI